MGNMLQDLFMVGVDVVRVDELGHGLASVEAACTDWQWQRVRAYLALGWRVLGISRMDSGLAVVLRRGRASRLLYDAARRRPEVDRHRPGGAV